MKNILFHCLASLLLATAVKAEQPVSYPQDKPEISLTFPDDWKLKAKGDAIYGHPAKDSSLFISLKPLEAGSDDLDAALTEVKELIEGDFKDVAYQKPQKTEAGGAELTVFNAKGTDDDGRANLNLVIIDPKQGGGLYLLKAISSPDGFEKHGDELTSVIGTIHAAGAASAEDAAESAADGDEAPALQTFSYPDKAHPDFAIDFPADWKQEPNDEGVYVESPDKLIAINVLFIDQADVDVAVEKIKKGVASKYESVEWNEPTSNEDEKLEVTAHFHSGMAEGEGVKYSLNVVQYVRKDGDKFMVLICQNPTKAVAKHGDALEAMLRSIKVR